MLALSWNWWKRIKEKKSFGFRFFALIYGRQLFDVWTIALLKIHCVCLSSPVIGYITAQWVQAGFLETSLWTELAANGILVQKVLCAWIQRFKDLVCLLWKMGMKAPECLARERSCILISVCNAFFYWIYQELNVLFQAMGFPCDHQLIQQLVRRTSYFFWFRYLCIDYDRNHTRWMGVLNCLVWRKIIMDSLLWLSVPIRKQLTSIMSLIATMPHVDMIFALFCIRFIKWGRINSANISNLFFSKWDK